MIEDARVRTAVRHVFKQARERGCCCAPVVTLAGWKEAPNGSPAPVLMVAHDDWCPYLRAAEGQLERLRLVEFDPSEPA